MEVPAVRPAPLKVGRAAHLPLRWEGGGGGLEAGVRSQRSQGVQFDAVHVKASGFASLSPHFLLRD